MSPSERFYRDRLHETASDDSSSLSSIPESDSELVASPKTPSRAPLLAMTSSKRHSAIPTMFCDTLDGQTGPETFNTPSTQPRKPRRGRPPINRPISTSSLSRGPGRPPVYTDIPSIITDPEEIKRERARQSNLASNACKKVRATLGAEIDALELMNKHLRGEVARLRTFISILKDGWLDPGEAGWESREEQLQRETGHIGTDKNAVVVGHEDVDARGGNIDDEDVDAEGENIDEDGRQVVL